MGVRPLPSVAYLRFHRVGQRSAPRPARPRRGLRHRSHPSVQIFQLVAEVDRVDVDFEIVLVLARACVLTLLRLLNLPRLETFAVAELTACCAATSVRFELPVDGRAVNVEAELEFSLPFRLLPLSSAFTPRFRIYPAASVIDDILPKTLIAAINRDILASSEFSLLAAGDILRGPSGVRLKPRNLDFPQ